MRRALYKTLLAGTAALAIAGSTLAYAQPAPGGRDGGPRAKMSAEDRAAFSDARIAAIRAGLKLTPEQEKNWPAAEAAYRDYAKQRADQRAARPSVDKPADPIDRLSKRADDLTQQGAALKKLAEATGTLYKSLDDGQKRRLMVLARFEGRDGMRGYRGHGKHHGGPRHERGPKGPDAPPAPRQ